MRSLQEVDEGVHGLLAADEAIVRTIRAHRQWLILTNRRLLGLSAGHRRERQKVLLNEPLPGIEVEAHWSWSKLDHVLLIHNGGGEVWQVPPPWGARRPWGPTIVRDIRHWAKVAEITAAEAARGREVDLALAHAHAQALLSLTPGQLARNLGLDPRHVREVLNERLGISVSKGAALEYTYTKRDRLQFNDDAKEKLFALLVDEYGAAGIVERAGDQEEWWETSAGQALENVAGAIDVELGHTSGRRAPIARWQSRMMWIGVAGAALTAILIFPPLIWAGSWKRWRDGTTDRPRAAIGLGAVTAAAFLAMLLTSLVANIGG